MNDTRLKHINHYGCSYLLILLLMSRSNEPKNVCAWLFGGKMDVDGHIGFKELPILWDPHLLFRWPLPLLLLHWLHECSWKLWNSPCAEHYLQGVLSHYTQMISTSWAQQNCLQKRISKGFFCKSLVRKMHYLLSACFSREAHFYLIPKRCSIRVLLHIISGKLPRCQCVSASGTIGRLLPMLATKWNVAEITLIIVASAGSSLAKYSQTRIMNSGRAKYALYRTRKVPLSLWL